MQVEALIKTSNSRFAGPLLLKPTLFGDDRGYFFESWNQRTWQNILSEQNQKDLEFVQDNHSKSEIGVLRGLHYQLPPHSQGKLVRCVVGEIFDVAIDIRLNSPTKGRSFTAYLSSDNHHQFWIPVGFAHGFLTLSSYAEVLYKTTDFWSPECERAIRWNDPVLAIDWPGTISNPKVSEKDSLAPFYTELTEEDFFL